MESLILSYRDIVLRDRIPADIEDHRRWLTTETAWLEWDAPWESADPDFNRQYLQKLDQRLQEPPPTVRSTLEICHRDGTHVGMVNAYYIDGDKDKLAAGITLRESRYWGKGLGSQAFVFWLTYLFKATGRQRLYCQTWSGNTRMLKLAAKSGFTEAARFKRFREIRGEKYDALNFVVTRPVFQVLYPDLLTAGTTR